jgi:hypothetical protein
MSSIQYTVRGVSERLNAELRKEARATGRTLNAVVVETLERAKLPAGGVVHEDLAWFIGSAPRGSSEQEAASQAWLDSLPADLA